MSESTPDSTESTDVPDEESSLPIRPTGDVMFKRSLRLRCPRCGEGPLFRRMYAMHATCSHCGLKYEPTPGYYLGSSYINYGLTTISLTILYIALHFGAGLTNQELTVPLLAYCVLFPLLTFRHARALWLAFDCYFDQSRFEED